MYKLAEVISKHKVVFVVLASLLSGVMLAPSAGVLAQQDDPSDTFGLSPVATELDQSLGSRDLRTTVAAIINVALSLLGIVAVVIILIGGFKWMTAGGSQDKVDEARKLIFSGIIGLAIIFASWAIARFVISSLSEATNSGQLPEDL